MMNKSLSEIGSSAYTHRAKTDRMNTQASEFFVSSPMTKTHRQNPENSTYMKIAINKTQISLNRGYLDMKRRLNERNKEQEKPQKTFQNNKFIVFKNLHEFQVNIQAQKGIIKQEECSDKFYGIATFKGTSKTINTHQISLHIGDVTVLSLFEGYDGSLAAITLKKKFTQNLLDYFKKRKSSARQASFPIVQDSIKMSIQKSQRELHQLQSKADDNSGTSLVSIISHHGIIFAVSCGESSIYCSSIGGKLMRLAVPHTTNNDLQVDRIVKSGGRLYQTIINVPFKKMMNIKGPLRIYPSGLTLTRTIGKSLQSSKQPAKDNSKQLKGITYIPQIQYIPESEVQWMIIVSSRVDEFVKKERIRDIIDQEMAKRATGYENSEASEHICKRILLEAVEGGSGQSVSAIFIISDVQSRQMKKHQELIKPKEVLVQPAQVSNLAENSTLSRQPRSLKYIGNRKNFVEQMRIE